MKLLFTNEWLRQTVPNDPDNEPQAGGTPESGTQETAAAGVRAGSAAVVGARNVVQLRISLGVLVRQLRVRDRLTIAELSQKADVTEEELRRVEHDPHFTAGPRLIFQLSSYFGVPLTKLSQLSGATHVVDRILYNQAVRFAAHSDDVSRLTDDERTALEAFVTLLSEHEEA
jgi:transcriptional regulator with XRE-family HTH domain